MLIKIFLDEEIESFSSHLSPSLNLGNPFTSPKNKLDKETD